MGRHGATPVEVDEDRQEPSLDDAKSTLDRARSAAVRGMSEPERLLAVF